MFGKHFASMYSGSMFGKPAMVFAVWGYVIAHMRPSRKDGACYVELNPTLLAATFASKPDEVLEAIRSLASADPGSRTKEAEGRRLVPLVDDFVLGPMQFLVVNGAKYRAMRDEEERRTYLREAKRKERASTKALTVNRRQPPSSQAEAEAEAEASISPTYLPPAQAVERKIHDTTTALRSRLYELVGIAEGCDPKKRDATVLMKLFTSYTKPDGRAVPGVINAALLSHERVEKSIADAEAQIQEWKHGA